MPCLPEHPSSSEEQTLANVWRSTSVGNKKAKPVIVLNGMYDARIKHYRGIVTF